MLKVLGYREHIQRKAKSGESLSEYQKKRNKRIAKIRARVEHPFAQMRHMGCKLIRTIGQARATVAMAMMAACYNLKRLAVFLENEVNPFCISPNRSNCSQRAMAYQMAYCWRVRKKNHLINQGVSFLSWRRLCPLILSSKQ